VPKAAYIPRGYSQTNDCFASLIIWAPDFKNSGRPLGEEFQILLDAIDTVVQKVSAHDAKDLLIQSRDEVVSARDMFLSNTSGDKEKRRVARKLLQHAYFELFKNVGLMLKPGGDIGPDDDV
jgi:hypothetical protein